MSSVAEQRAPVTTGRLAGLVGSLCAIYMASHFLRNSVGVIASDLVRELGLAPAEIGLLSSIFFLTFAAAQLPLGVAIDRWGAKAALLACSAIVVLGTIVFARAGGFAELLAARALLGLGCCSMLVAPLVIYGRWIAQSRFSTVAGLQIGFGS